MTDQTKKDDWDLEGGAILEPSSEPKRIVVSVSMNLKEHAAISRYASELGMKISTYLKELALQGLSPMETSIALTGGTPEGTASLLLTNTGFHANTWAPGSVDLPDSATTGALA